MSRRVREEEEWARRVIARHLRRVVELNDDGSRDSMYDFRVGQPASPEFAIECVQNYPSSDAVRVWKKGPVNGPFRLGTKGTWVVEISESCHAGELLTKLGHLLATLYAAGCLHIANESSADGTVFDMTQKLAGLGVTDAYCDPNGDGCVHFSMASPGGIVDSTGADLADWVTKFLGSEGREDVRGKLNSSGAANRHACIILRLISDMTGPLLHPIIFHPCPTVAPVPAEVTGVWLLLPSDLKGLFWDSTGWCAVDADVPALESSSDADA